MPGEGERGLGQERSLGIREVKGPGGHQSLPSLYSPASWDWGSRTPCSPHFYQLTVKLFIYPQGPVPPRRCPIVLSDLQGVMTSVLGSLAALELQPRSPVPPEHV